MITIADYFGKWLHHPNVTDEVMANAERLLDHVDQLMALASYDNVPMPVNDNTNSQVSGVEYGGFRPQSCPIGASNSAHKEGLAVDVYDPHGDLDTWVNDTILEQCGLYREHPTATDGWCHLTTRAPGSKHRTFVP